MKLFIVNSTSMFKIIGFLFFLFIGTGAFAQFINPESVRLKKDSTGFSGSIGLDVTLIKNTSTIFSLGNSIYIQYNKNKHLVFFINSINLKTVNDESIIDKGTQHLRYNYKLYDKIALEAFVQNHYNQISKIDTRRLFGLGPRFTLYDKDKFEIYLGTLLMYEYEKIEEEQVVYNKDFRFSGYASFRWFPIKNTSIASTTFYQPRLDEFSDYRIYSTNSIFFKVVKGLSIGITYIATFDTQPAIDIPKYQYRLMNGFTYTFD